MPLDFEILGRGIYTPRQAARLIGGSPQDVRRWTRGSGPSEPLWNAYYQEIDDTAELSFADLVELRVVRALRRAGITMQAIRYAIAFAQETFDIEKPLSSKKFQTDGSQILMQAIENDGELVSLSKRYPGQKVFAKVVLPSLKNLEYDRGHVARWRPARTDTIVIDPKRQFGTPILDEYGVSTETLYSEFQSFENFSYLSEIYEVPKALIKDAINYERQLDQASGKSSV
ncbi:hypothetical protein L0666_11950 [Octadecabacter sp. CECT 8868]|uniref:hypothetical protein n=1 Tax=Octadecabacter algicola TaxID=2909342 RepID=UPI001F2DB876|nr:hypothetical protein [Octadecabacter algicola]MCF2905702.1 hypothetical protein [Octadecabacter algicola]